MILALILGGFLMASLMTGAFHLPNLFHEIEMYCQYDTSVTVFLFVVAWQFIREIRYRMSVACHHRHHLIALEEITSIPGFEASVPSFLE